MARPVMTVGKAITMMRSAIVNSRIYPKGSQMVESALKSAHQALTACLLESDPIIISDLQGKLCVNGKEVVEAKDFRPFLVQHEVQSIKILKGVTQDELATLLDGLGRHKDQLETPNNLGKWLTANNVTHIQTEEIEFVELKKGEVVIQQALSLMEQSAGDIQTMANSIDESLRMVDRLPDEPARVQARRQMASYLSTLPPQELRDLFQTKLPERVEKSGIQGDVVKAMSREKLEETLEEVNRWYKQIKEETESEFDVVEKLNGLKSFLGKILNSPSSNAVPFALYEELLNVGLIEQIPDGVKKGENSGLMAEVEQMLSRPSEALLEVHARQRFPELLKALCALGLEEFLQKLTDKVLENLNNPAPLMRETAVKTARVFEESLAANRKDKPFMQVVGALHKLAESESSPDVYGQVTQALQQAAMELLVSWRFEESARLLSTLRRHGREESPIGQKKKELAVKALRDFSVRGLDVICADLNAPLKDRQNGSYRVLAELGEEAVGPLVEAVKRSSDLRSRQAAIQALKRLGPSVRDSLLRQMSIGTSGEALVKLIAVMDDFADVTLLPTLMGLLQHPDLEVRRHVAQLMAKIDDPKIQSILVGLLDDTSVEVQTEAMRLIGEKRFKLTTTELLRRLPISAPVVQEEICIALGNFVDKKAVPVIAALLQNEKAFWRRGSGTPDAVKLRAIWALGQLLPDEQAQHALTRASKDPNLNIQRAAQNALARLSITKTTNQAAA